MTQSGNDGANLVEGREYLLVQRLSRGSRIVIECEEETGPKHRVIVRVYREQRIDGDTPRRA